MKLLDLSIHTTESPRTTCRNGHSVDRKLLLSLSDRSAPYVITLVSNPQLILLLENPKYKVALWQTFERKFGRLLQVTEGTACYIYRNIRVSFSRKALKFGTGGSLLSEDEVES